MTRIVVAAASDVARAGLVSLLSGMSGIEVVDRVASPPALARSIEIASPDAVLVDMEQQEEESAALLAAATESASGPSVVVMSDVAVELRSTDGRRLSGWALLPRRASSSEIEAAIRAASAGLVVTHPDLLLPLALSGQRGATTDHAVLTPREIEVLRMLADGLPNKTIAMRLGVSSHTIKFHVGSIMAKLHSSSRTEAVTEGIRRGLIYL